MAQIQEEEIEEEVGAHGKEVDYEEKEKPSQEKPHDFSSVPMGLGSDGLGLNATQ